MELLSFRATNFRGFLDTSHVNLKKINLLIGKNSIGKSSFARLWPIFLQGTKVQKRAPILWNGDLVDFGTFQNVLSRHANSGEVGFEFRLSVGKLETLSASRYARMGNKIRHLRESELLFRIGLIKDGEESNRTRCSHIDIEGDGFKVVYIYDSEGSIERVTCNSGLVKPLSNHVQQTSVGFLVPFTEFFLKSDKGVIPSYSPQQIRLLGYLRSTLHQRLSTDRIRDIFSKLNVVGNKEEILKYCFTLPFEYKSWRDFLHGLANDEYKLDVFHSYVTLAASEQLLKDIDLSLKQYFAEVSYLRPLRAVAQRYYRKQELAVDNIDSEGANLAFFLESLSMKERANLNSWLAEKLDVEFKLDEEEGHVMIKLHDLSTGRFDNIADMGFGFSQVLPLAVQAWLSSSPSAHSDERLARNNPILVWEQPELHLHPAMQRKLAKLIVATVKQAKNIIFIIETHSQSIINEFGDLMITEGFPKENVQAILFSQRGDAETVVKITSYDEDGQLIDWPVGFLAT